MNAIDRFENVRKQTTNWELVKRRSTYRVSCLAYAAIVTVTLLFASNVVQAAEGPATFRFSKDVKRAAAPAEEILAVTLDSEVYAATRDQFPDLRFLDQDGVEVPYVVRKATETRVKIVRQSVRSNVVTLHETQANQIEVLIRLDKDALSADGFTVVTPLKDYERRVRVFGSADGANWTPLVDNGLVFDYSRYMDVNSGDIPLPKNAHRQFKVVIDDITEERESPYRHLTRTFRDGREQERVESTSLNRRPFRINRLSFWHNVEREQVKAEKTAEYPVADFRVEEDPETKSSIVHIHTHREPLISFTLITDSRNFSRRAAVEVPVIQGVQTHWQPAGQATVSVIDFGDLNHEELTLAFPEQRQEEYRITILNQDNAPVNITGIKAEGNVYRAVFLASKDAGYRAYYGSETAETLRYDTAAVVASLREGYQPVEATLEAQVANPAFDKASDFAFGRILENKFVLGGMIAVMVVVLGYILFRAGRKVGETPWE